jgi:hypothetical protein
MFGTMEPWGYGGYGQFHMVIWIILAIAVVAGVVWRLRSGSSWYALAVPFVAHGASATE